MILKLTPLRLRRAAQAVFLLLSLSAGWRLWAFCQWAVGARPEFVSRAPSVEGFLPISALLGLRNLLAGGGWDPVHPAGLTILLAALGLALFARKGFCGHVCPVGLISDLLVSAGRRAGLERPVRGRADSLLRLLKYPLLFFFLWSVFFAMDQESVSAFLTGSYNLTADARMLRFFLAPSGAALGVFGALAAVSVVVRNPWCRWLCPYGALLGLAALAGPLAVRRAKAACTGCKRCDRACPAAIPVSELKVVRRPECVGCAQCVGVCPEPGVLELAFAGRALPWWAAALGALSLFTAAWLLAVAFGAWNSTLPPQMLKMIYARALAG